jgi:hypothetical protein
MNNHSIIKSMPRKKEQFNLIPAVGADAGAQDIEMPRLKAVKALSTR